MTKQQATAEFKEMYPNYKQETKADYCKMQLIWSTYVDGLCKDGQITQKQYDTWLAPFQR